MEQTPEENQTPVNDEQQVAAAPEAKTEYVPKSAFDRVKEDMHKYKSQLRMMEENSLKEKEDWKTLAERREAEKQEALERADRIEQSFIGEKKYSAVERAALKAGIRPEALSDLPMLGMEGVVVETTSTGKVNVLGAENYIQQLKQIRPHWFGGSPVKVNSNLPDVSSEKAVTESDLIKLSLEAAKTGDFSKYKAANARFQNKK